MPFENALFDACKTTYIINTRAVHGLWGYGTAS